MKIRTINTPDVELLDIVNEEDKVVTQMLRSEALIKIASTKEKLYLRVVNCFLVNSKGQLWIPTRSVNKKLFPNAYDFSCGGYVQAGETYETAMLEEIREELNIKNPEMNFLAIIPARILPSRAFMGLFIIYSDIEPDYNKEDFQSGKWILPEDLAKEIDGGAYAKTDILTALKYITK